MATKEIRVLRKAVLSLGTKIGEGDASLEETVVFVRLANVYRRFLAVAKSSSKKKWDPFVDGDPNYCAMLSKETMDDE